MAKKTGVQKHKRSEDSMAVRSAREAAYETIRSRIITMELKPGDELNDHELAQELGISRTPMREALIMLNIAHMVTIKPQSGTYVAPLIWS
jgi:DNA-binding GntR family transcriptional regulator